MITKQEALTADRFHEDHATRKDGTCYVWRRNGVTKTWARDPGRFRVPVKYGLRDYGEITQANAGRFHTEAACPYGNV